MPNFLGENFLHMNSQNVDKPLTQLSAWQDLRYHHAQMQETHLRTLFSEDPHRVEKMSFHAVGIYCDYSKHRITPKTLQLLMVLAEQSQLKTKIEALFKGEKINVTEQRAALHTALRTPHDAMIELDGIDVVRQVHSVLNQMSIFSEQIRQNIWRGCTQKPIRHIINIGIGGSDLGPVMAYEALQYYSQRDISFRFVSNVDPADFEEAIRGLNPEETLFIIASKTFTTSETMTNARAARDWLLSHLKHSDAIRRHCVALSTNLQAVTEFGIDVKNTFAFWDWVGGRYSLCSAIGLSTMIAIGAENFYDLLAGYHAMDEHFREAPWDQNMPVLLGMLNIWYRNFFEANTLAILPYSHYLRHFPAYLQQLMMESNGKSVTLAGAEVNYATAPILWGEAGTNGQHSFYQLLHQGTQLVPCDFILFAESLNADQRAHQLLLANAIAQSAALAFGKTLSEVKADLMPSELISHRIFRGNQPSTTLLLEQLTPSALGKLIALYEHITFVQSVIWQINPFDQWGVELGKKLAVGILPFLEEKKDSFLPYDASTNRLITLCQSYQHS